MGRNTMFPFRASPFGCGRCFGLWIFPSDFVSWSRQCEVFRFLLHVNKVLGELGPTLWQPPRQLARPRGLFPNHYHL